MKFGYARVSTQDQNLERQIDAVKKYGVDEILQEKMTGTKKDRPELNRLRDKVRSGDVIVIESFSRLGRSTKDLIELVEEFNGKGIQIVSLKENFDTTTPQGRLMLTVFQAISQFERDLISQRTRDSLAVARARGRIGGRPPKDKRKINVALTMYNSKNYTLAEIREATGISKATLYRYLKEE